MGVAISEERKCPIVLGTVELTPCVETCTTIQSLTTANAELTAQLAEARGALREIEIHSNSYMGVASATRNEQVWEAVAGAGTLAHKALSLIPSDALARYEAMEKVAEAARDWAMNELGRRTEAKNGDFGSCHSKAERLEDELIAAVWAMKEATNHA
jgi:hypothetical protein